MTIEKMTLRQRYRDKRKALSHADRLISAEKILKHISQDPTFQTAQHIGLYRSLPEEVPTEPLFEWAQTHQKTCYVPLVTTEKSLTFVAVTPNTTWKSNQYGVLEPTNSSHLERDPKALDVVFVPLVSFDNEGSRLGMGAGFYDKTFAFKQEQSNPLLVGLAFECQRHDKLPISDWDIPLDQVVTEKNSVDFRKLKK